MSAGVVYDGETVTGILAVIMKANLDSAPEDRLQAEGVNLWLSAPDFELLGGEDNERLRL